MTSQHVGKENINTLSFPFHNLKENGVTSLVSVIGWYFTQHIIYPTLFGGYLKKGMLHAGPYSSKVYGLGRYYTLENI
jgi:hypothetical protein